MMQIIINGSPRSVDDSLSAQELLEQLGISEKKLALEVNEEIIPRSKLSKCIIKPDDKIEIIRAIGGG